MLAVRLVICGLFGIVYAGAVQATDLTLRQRTGFGDPARQGFESTEYWSGAKHASDLGDSRVIADVEARTITVLNKETKTYTLRTVPPVASPPPTVGAVSVTPTGNSRKIAGVEAKEYTFRGAHVHGTLWVTEAWSDLPAVAQARLSARHDNVAAVLASALEQTQGMPLLMTMIVMDGSVERTTTTEVVNVEATVPADAFSIPSEYKKVAPGSQ